MNRTLVTGLGEASAKKILPTPYTNRPADYHSEMESNLLLAASVMLRSSAPVLTALLTLLLPALVFSLTTAKSTAIDLEATSCMDVDEAVLREYLLTLNLSSDHNVTGMIYNHKDSDPSDEKEVLPFGALRSDWVRLSLLHDVQPEETMRETLRHLSRLLVVAYFQTQDGDTSQRSSIMQQIPGQRSVDMPAQLDDDTTTSLFENTTFDSIIADLSTEESVTAALEKKEDLRDEVRNCQKSLQRCLSGHASIVKEIHNDAETFNEQLTSTEKTMLEQIDSATEVFRNFKSSEASMSVRHYPAAQWSEHRRCSPDASASSRVNSRTDGTKEDIDRESQTEEPCAGSLEVQETTESFAYISVPSDFNVEQFTPKASGDPLPYSSYSEQLGDGLLKEINAINNKEGRKESNETLTESANDSFSMRESLRVTKESNKSSENTPTRSINWLIPPGKSKRVDEKKGTTEIEANISKSKNISASKYLKSTDDVETTEEVPVQTTTEMAEKKKTMLKILIENVREASRIAPESQINFYSQHLTEVTESNARKTFADLENSTEHNIKSTGGTAAKTRPLEYAKLSEDNNTSNSNVSVNGSVTGNVILVKTVAKGIEQFNKTEEKVFSSSELTGVTRSSKELNETYSVENFMISGESEEVTKNLSQVSNAAFPYQMISIDQVENDSEFDNDTNFGGHNLERLPTRETSKYKVTEGETEDELPQPNIDRNLSDDVKLNGTANLMEFHESITNEPSNTDEESQNSSTIGKTDSFLWASAGFFRSDPTERWRLYGSMTMKTRTRVDESKAVSTERYSNGITFPSDSTFDSASAGNGMEDRSTFTASLKYSDTEAPSRRQLSYDEDLRGEKKTPCDNVSRGAKSVAKVGDVDSTQVGGIITTSETFDSSSRMSGAFPKSESDFVKEISASERMVISADLLNKEDSSQRVIGKNVSFDKTSSPSNNPWSVLMFDGNKEIESNLQLKRESTSNLQESKVLKEREVKIVEIASATPKSDTGGDASKSGRRFKNSSNIQLASDVIGHRSVISFFPTGKVKRHSRGTLPGIESHLHTAAHTSEEPPPINHDEEISFDGSRRIGRTRMNLPNTRKQETTDVNAE